MKTGTDKRRPARPKVDDPAQSRLFIETARELGADEERSEADDLLGSLHKKKPMPRKTPKKSQ